MNDNPAVEAALAAAVEATRVDREVLHKPVTRAMFEIACGARGEPGVMREHHHDLAIDTLALSVAAHGERYVWIVRESGTHLFKGPVGDPGVDERVARILGWTRRVQIWEIVVVDVYKGVCTGFLRPCSRWDEWVDWREDTREDTREPAEPAPGA